MGRAITVERCSGETGSRSQRNATVRRVPSDVPRRTADETLAEYKPILEEVERILAEAGLDEEEMRKGAAAGPHNPSGQSRNRR